ncbi:hypothetical protein CXR04_21090 [Streptomyces sp. CMB-StM0423]|nr:hypothetical protein CXR04_21090 [Streptomyces sp. CMB-StM0423]
MGIDHGVANLERHVTGTPSVAIQGNTAQAASEWRFRRSGPVSGLDNRPWNVLRPPPESWFPQVGPPLPETRNAKVTCRRKVRQGDDRPDLSESAGEVVLLRSADHERIRPDSLN